MESTSLHKIELLAHTLKQMNEACDIILLWNKDIHDPEDYLTSPDGMKNMAATCMLIESISEGVKKIDKTHPDFLNANAPEIHWTEIKGLRNHIAHGYFNLDSEIIFDVVKSDIPELKTALQQLHSLLKNGVV